MMAFRVNLWAGDADIHEILTENSQTSSLFKLLVRPIHPSNFMIYDLW